VTWGTSQHQQITSYHRLLKYKTKISPTAITFQRSQQLNNTHMNSNVIHQQEKIDNNGNVRNNSNIKDNNNKTATTTS
jgi:hypothetical protein